jgi:hypothetical protein
VDGLSGRRQDTVGLDDLDRPCGSLRILPCRTLDCALSTPRQQMRAIHEQGTGKPRHEGSRRNNVDATRAYLVVVESRPIVVPDRWVERLLRVVTQDPVQGFWRSLQAERSAVDTYCQSELSIADRRYAVDG